MKGITPVGVICAFLATGCSLFASAPPPTYYGVYRIRSLPSHTEDGKHHAHVIGPHDSDWGDAGDDHVFKSTTSGCKTYEIRIVMKDYADTPAHLEACTNQTSLDAARQDLADDPGTFSKVFRLDEQLSGSWVVNITSQPPGAVVFVDDTPQPGQTPLQPIALKWSTTQKTKVVRFELPGYQPAAVTIAYPQATASAVLQPIHAEAR